MQSSRCTSQDDTGAGTGTDAGASAEGGAGRGVRVRLDKAVRLTLVSEIRKLISKPPDAVALFRAFDIWFSDWRLSFERKGLAKLGTDASGRTSLEVGWRGTFARNYVGT